MRRLVDWLRARNLVPIHLDDGKGKAACNHWIVEASLTTRKSEVTCNACRRTDVFKGSCAGD